MKTVRVFLQDIRWHDRRGAAPRGMRHLGADLTVYAAVWLALVLAAAAPCHGAGDIHPEHKWAWSTNAGWINHQPAHGGVTVYGDHLEGYAWAESLGWIRLGTHTGGGAHTYANTSATDYGVNRAGSTLSGYAWSTNAGWVDFAPTHGGVSLDPATGELSGHAWGESIGWIRFAGTAQDEAAYKVAALTAPEFVVPLSAGFNLVSLGEPSANDPITTLMDPIMGNLIRVVGFETDAINPNPPETGGKLYSPVLEPFINTLKLTDFHLGYWLVMSAADTLITGGGLAKPVSMTVTGDGGLYPVYDFMGIHGELRVDGEPAPVGTLVEVIDEQGTLAGRFEVHHAGYYGFLPIYRDDSGTQVDEGADMGEWLTVRVNGQPMSERVQWTAFGDVVRLDLAATSQPSSPLPSTFALGHNYPNPFNPNTTISYQLAHEEEVVLSIWNLAGQLVRELVHTTQTAGLYSVGWDGRDGAGNLVANGVYVYEIRAGDFQTAHKMVLMK